MARAIRELKKARRLALRPKVEDWIKKIEWEDLPREQKKRHDDGSRHIRLNKTNGTLIRWICVDWRS